MEFELEVGGKSASVDVEYSLYQFYTNIADQRLKGVDPATLRFTIVFDGEEGIALTESTAPPPVFEAVLNEVDHRLWSIE